MTIDFHTHIFPENIAKRTIDKLESASRTVAYLDGRIESLKSAMVAAKVDLSIALPVATAVKQVIKLNDVATLINEQNKDVHSFGAMHPDFEDYKNELKRVKSLGLKGIKLHPDYQATYIDDIKYKRVIDEASSLGLITVIHAGLDIGLPSPIHATPTRIRALIDDVAPQNFVLAHMGGVTLWDEVLDKLSGTGVYLDTSTSTGEIQYNKDVLEEEKSFKLMNDEMFKTLIKAFGTDKILFASDSPWGDQDKTRADILRLGLSHEDEEKILSGNARKLLSLIRNS